MHRPGLVIEVEWRRSLLGTMAAGDDTGRAVLEAIIVEISQGVHNVARPLSRQIAVQLLMTAICKGLATLHLREEEPFTDQLTNHRQQRRQTTHGLNLRVEVQQNGASSWPAARAIGLTASRLHRTPR